VRQRHQTGIADQSIPPAETLLRLLDQARQVFALADVDGPSAAASPMPLDAPVMATTFPLTSDISSTFLLDGQPLTCLRVAWSNLTRYIHANISFSNDK
jgi:hypothetical protein